LAGSINIYPNPASATVTIDAQSLKIESMKLFNLMGEVVLSESKLDNGKLTIDVSAMAKGIYTVEVMSNGAKMFKKLVIQ
jgi:hypothetical protein